MILNDICSFLKGVYNMSGLEMKYFVLKPKGSDVYARASREALMAYSRFIKDENPKLSEDISKWVLEEEGNSNMEEVEIEISREELLPLYEEAHRRNITFNQLCNNILREQIENIEDDEEFIQELTKEKSGE